MRVEDEHVDMMHLHLDSSLDFLPSPRYTTNIPRLLTPQPRVKLIYPSDISAIGLRPSDPRAFGARAPCAASRQSSRRCHSNHPHALTPPILTACSTPHSSRIQARHPRVRHRIDLSRSENTRRRRMAACRARRNGRTPGIPRPTRTSQCLNPRAYLYLHRVGPAQNRRPLGPLVKAAE